MDLEADAGAGAGNVCHRRRTVAKHAAEVGWSVLREASALNHIALLDLGMESFGHLEKGFLYVVQRTASVRRPGEGDV